MTAWINFLCITSDIGPDFTTLYNGPRSGASGPDHLHFQAMPAGEMLIEKELGQRDKFSVVNATDHIRISSGQGLGREIILIEGSDPGTSPLQPGDRSTLCGQTQGNMENR